MSKQTGPYPPHIYTYMSTSNPSAPPIPPLKKGGLSRVQWSMLILALILLITAFLPYGILRIWQTPYYQPLRANMLVARVHATTTGTLNVMSVDLALYKTDGSIYYHHTYLVKGEKWMLREVVIVYPSWTGRPSGYKIVQLAGYDGNNVYQPVKDGGMLNGGEDTFYSFLKAHSWTSSFGKATDYKVYVKPGPRPQGTLYNILLNADGSMRAQQLEMRT
jgi:hypothetical protein